MSRCWELDLPSNQKFVLVSMADFADDDGRQCFPSIARLAWKCGYSERAIQRIIRELETAGIVVTIRRSQGGRNHVNQYWIRPEHGKKLEPFHNPGKMTGFADDTPSDATETPSSATRNPDRMTPETLINHQEPLEEVDPMQKHYDRIREVARLTAEEHQRRRNRDR